MLKVGDILFTGKVVTEQFVKEQEKITWEIEREKDGSDLQELLKDVRHKCFVIFANSK